MRRFLPYPLLSLAILLFWLLLSGISPGQILLGSLIALFCGQAMTRLQQKKICIRRWHLLPVLFWRVLCDIIASNFAVAKIILTGGRKKAPSGFIIVQLSLHNRMAVALLACIITATPGTAWIAYDYRSSKLLLHILNLVEESYWHNLVKTRYESLLAEIFA